MKICTHLANLSTFDATKFQIFLIFFAIFLRWSKLFDRTVTAHKDISIRATNDRGANLSSGFQLGAEMELSLEIMAQLPRSHKEAEEQLLHTRIS